MQAVVVTGIEAILMHSQLLEDLALRCGQPCAMHGLRLLLTSRYAARKRPYLICFRDTSETPKAIGELCAAALLLEYRIAGLGTGLFATADSFGVRTVIAPDHLRDEVARSAVDTMLCRGARFVLLSYKRSTPAKSDLARSSRAKPFEYARQYRHVQDTLLLHDSADATLATLGKRTRVHLRSARRHFDSTFPKAEFADALPMLASLSSRDLRQMNETCLDPIDQADFDHQVSSISGNGGFALGLFEGERWLALVAGWRQGDATWVEWQVNASGYEKLSLGSVLRSYLLEHEIALGMRSLSFHGGTSHSMAHSFLQDEVTDLVGRRAGVLSSFMVFVARKACSWFSGLQHRGNFLMDALASDELVWSHTFRN